MRTTLILDDDVARQAKGRAAELGITLSALVNQALREVLRPRRRAEEPPFRMLTYGGGGQQVGPEPEEIDAILRAQDLSALGGED
jgi:hypothetical protein